MNAHCFKTVFSKRLGSLVAVGEHASSQGKATGASTPAHNISSTSSAFSASWGTGFCGALSTTFAFVTLAWASPAWAQPQVQPATNALPAGGQVVQGAVQFNTQAQQLNITQSTDRAAVNWQSFDIGAAAKVHVVQPSAQSVLLNRVGGEAPSQIFGQLQANGQVILVNPNGMVFGKDGSVSAAGFTGSTLNISDADFMAGKERYTRSGTAAATSAIVNRGLIQAAPGGYVALLGASVSNEGRIEAPQGNVFMAAADAVTLPSQASTVGVPIGQSGRIKLELTPASINAAVANHKGGTIVTEGGQVYLQAAAVNAALASIIQSGSIDTTGVKGGQVHVLADGGHIRVNGSIKANSTDGSAGGDIYIGRDKDTNVLAAVGDASGARLESKGGFVETSGSFLKTDGTRVIAKDWLLDPSDITISNSTSSNVTGTSPADITPNGGAGTTSNVQVSTIQDAINQGTNVTIRTTNTLNPTGAGNITIANALAFTNNGAQDATLSLIADNGITQNAAITTTGGSRLVNISMTANGNFQGNTAASVNSRGLTLNAGITTNGNITLTGNNQSGATDGAGAGVYINRQTVNAGTSDVTITGTATNGAGAFIHGNSVIRGGNITINGTANTTAANMSGIGVHLFRDGTTTIAATNNLAITGMVTGTGTGNGIRANGGNVGTAVLMTAGGNATLRGIQRGNANNTSSAMYLSGFRVNATGDVTLQAEAANSNSLAIHMNREAGALNNFDDGWRMQVRSSGGNVLIQSNQGAIVGADINTALTISGRNVTLDNTGAGMTVNGVANANGGSIDSTTGAITLGSGTSTFSGTVGNSWTGGNWVPTGVSLSGGAFSVGSNTNVTATGNLTIGGSSSAAQGVIVGLGAPVSAGGNINLAGRSTLAGVNALDVNASLTSTAGNITLSGDRMNIGANVRAGTAGANTVTVNTVSAANKIDIGSGTGVSGVDAAGTLGLSQTELNRITAGNLVIGDTANTGGITVSAATTTNATSGNLTLLSGGNITINGALTVGSATPSKNLTLHGAGATSTVTQTAAVKAAGLELLGSNATHTLNTAGNDIKTLAGNTGSVSLTNQGDLEISSVNTDGLTGTGTVSISTAAVSTANPGNITLKKSINAANVNLNAAGAVLRDAALATDGIIQATSLLRIKAGSNIGTSGSRIQTNVATLSMESVGDQFVTEADTVTVAAKTSNNGSIDIAANGGTLTVGSSTLIDGTTAIHGVTANGSGNITLSGTSSTADGLVVARAVTADAGNINLSGTSSVNNGINIGSGINITSATGDVSLIGTTLSTFTSTTGPWAGISFRNFVSPAGRVSGKNITMNADATGTTGNALGYWGRAGEFVAAETLKITGGSIGNNALYSVGGLFSSGTGMTMNGTSQAANSAIALVNGVTLNNGISGGISITGTASSDQAAILLGNAGTNAITNSGSDGVKLTALKGSIVLNSGTNTITNNGSGEVVLRAMPSLDTSTGADHEGAIDGTRLTITQTGSGGVQMLTSGKGDISAPKMVLNGGNVVIAAGTAVAQGDGSGGQVKTVAGNNITGAARTFIHTGSATGTGLLANLGVFGADLRLSTIGSDTQNAASNRRYQQGSIQPGPGGANAQVMFREKVALGGNLTDVTNTYGDSTSNIDMLSKLQAANLDATVLATTATAGTFKIAKTALMADVTGASMATALGVTANMSKAGHLKASTTGYAMDVTGNNYNLSGVSAKLTVGQLALTGVTIDAAGNTYGGTVAGGAINFNGSNKFAGDVIVGTASVVSTGTDLSSSFNLKAGAYFQTADGTALSGDDAGNYSLAPITTATANYVVDRLALTGSIALGSSTYGSTLTPGAVTLSNKVGTDDVSATGVTIVTANNTSTSGNLRAGNYTGIQIVSGLTGTDSDNYSFANVKGDYTVDRLALTGSIALGSSTYGSTLSPGAVTLSNKVGADVVSATGVTIDTASNTSTSGNLRAGSYTGIQSVSGLTGTDSDNYSFANVKGDYTVNRLALTGSIAPGSSTYGSTLTPGAVTLSNKVGSDDVSATGVTIATAGNTSTSGNLRAGSYTGIQSVSGLIGNDRDNYSFANVKGDYTVGQLALTSSIAAVTTVYGTAATTGAVAVSAGLNGDDVRVSPTAVATLVGAVTTGSGNLAAGSYLQTAAAALEGADAGNYTTSATAAANYVVTPRVINASVTAADKVYDGSVAATLVATSADILLGDVVNVTGLTGSFASRNVVRDGTGNVLAQAVTVSGSAAALGGADGANYVLGNAASVPATTARITPRELSVSGITASDKVYDGNTTAVISVANAVLANVVAADSVSVSAQNAQGNFADKDVARGAAGQVLAKAVQVSGLQLQGADAGNYNLQANGVSAQASITPRPVSLSGNSAVDKVADGTTTAQVIAGTLNGLVAGESLNVNAQGEFEDALVGTNKAVNARFALENGALGLASNYQLSNPVEVLRASIVAFVPGTVDPGRVGGGGSSGNRVSFGGGSGTGAATGVNDEPVDPELVEQCSVLSPEKCECESTQLPGVEMCFAPTRSVSLKD
jgi:filamentous hemagglutinin family protein